MELGPEVVDIVFRGVEFSVKMEVEKGLLMVEISDSVTADQWRGEFDPAYIEDLTRKTGNFKQFPIFCSMLESAVKKTSDSVTLDLLTYADLELLRNRKAGVVSRSRPPQSSPLTAKRYLILIYTVEFDRIHYPLPLPFVGKPDPAALQKEVRALRNELSALSSHGVNKSAELEIRRLRAELALMKEEKEATAKVLERLQIGGGGFSLAREDWRFQDVVRTLEELVLKERAKSQRSASKRSQEQRDLLEQLEELRASECALQIRVKSLTNELASLQRGRVTPVQSSRLGCRADGNIHRSLSRERRSGPGVLRDRSGSRERMENRRQRSEERGRRADSSGPRSRLLRPSPSPTGSRTPRFDPTAYIQDRQRRLKDTELKRQKKVRRDMMPSPTVPERGRSRSREICPHTARAGSRGGSLSVERRRSRNSSESSLVDMDEAKKAPPRRGRKQTYNGASVSRGGLLTRKPVCSTPTYRIKAKESSVDADAELSEIDARLQALQEYMRDLDTGC